MWVVEPKKTRGTNVTVHTAKILFGRQKRWRPGDIEISIIKNDE